MSIWKYFLSVLCVISIFSCGGDDCNRLPDTVPYESTGKAHFNGEIKVTEGVFYKPSEFNEDYNLTLRFDENGTRFELHFSEIYLNDNIQYLSMRDTFNFDDPPFSAFVQIFGCDSNIYELNENDNQQDFIKFSEIDTLNQIFKGEFELSLFYRKSRSTALYGHELLIENGQFDLILLK